MPPARLSIGGGTNGWLGASAGDFENNNSGRTTPYFKCIVVAMLSEAESAHAKPWNGGVRTLLPQVLGLVELKILEERFDGAKGKTTDNNKTSQ